MSHAEGKKTDKIFNVLLESHQAIDISKHENLVKLQERQGRLPYLNVLCSAILAANEAEQKSPGQYMLSEAYKLAAQKKSPWLVLDSLEKAWEQTAKEDQQTRDFAEAKELRIRKAFNLSPDVEIPSSGIANLAATSVELRAMLSDEKIRAGYAGRSTEDLRQQALKATEGVDIKAQAAQYAPPTTGKKENGTGKLGTHVR